MPKAFPPEFRRDVIAVARQGDRTIADISRSFGVSESCIARWVRIANRQDGLGSPPGQAPAGSAVDLEAENRELRKKAQRLEQENDVLRRATAYFARDVLPK
jgi:transposase-like protein